MKLTALFLFIGCLILTFAPAVRLHSLDVEYRWQQWIGFIIWLIGFSIIYKQFNHFLLDHDPYLLPIMAFLTGWGLLTIFRLDPEYGVRQTIWLAVCCAGVIIGIRFNSLLIILRRYKYIWLSVGLLLVILTFFFGTYPGGVGPNLWLGCCGVYLQPSEFLKILLIIYLAAYLADSLTTKFRLMQLLTPTLLVTGIAILVLVAQRDLGTASLFIFLYTVVIYIATGKRRLLLISFLIVCAALIAGYFVFDVIKLRVEAWINPWLDPSGRSYQVVQSILAIANGGIFGRGIGLGSPGVVPVANSDFIFSSIVEENGLIGAVAIIILYGVITTRGFSISLHAPNQFQRFLAAGLTTYIITQAILIIGGTIRLLPLTGVTLPFMSYGGSSLVISFFAMLLLLIISNQAEDQPAVIYQSRSYLFVGTVLLIGLVAVVIVTSWWGVFRADNLVNRNDNPRRFISDQYVLRGRILDRNNIVLAETVGESGTYKRILHYPSLSSVIGYSNSNFGQAGLEASMDSTLRGVEGNTDFTILTKRLLYAQYPQGLDIRLGLDLALQQKADELMQTQTGGIILLNADTGEVLAMATAPTFDSNSLELNWENWKSNPNSPLLNRVSQGLYPPGAVVGGLLLANTLSRTTLPVLPDDFWGTDWDQEDYCAIFPGTSPTWKELISSGCTAALTNLTRDLHPANIQTLYENMGLFTSPEIALDSVQPINKNFLTTSDHLFTGSNDLLVSPLQVAIFSASLSNGGKLVTPQLVTSFLNPENEWKLIEVPQDNLPLSSFNTTAASDYLLSGSFPGWEISAVAQTDETLINWYVAGTPTDWQGASVVVVVALEKSTPDIAQKIGQSIFNAALSTSE